MGGGGKLNGAPGGINGPGGVGINGPGGVGINAPGGGTDDGPLP